MTKIISICANKGGVGKSSISFNLADYLSFVHDKKVLLIDLDESCNLTQFFEIYENNETVAGIFNTSKPAPKIFSVRDNTYLIAGYKELDILSDSLILQDVMNKEYLMFLWMKKNKEIIEQFDYVIIDNHPDFKLPLKNSLVCADHIISLIEPSQGSLVGKYDIENRINEFRGQATDIMTGSSYVKGDIQFYLNRIKHNTKSSRVLLETFIEAEEMDDEAPVLGAIPEKELINVSTLENKPIFTFEEENIKSNNNNKKFYKKVHEVFSIIKENIDK